MRSLLLLSVLAVSAAGADFSFGVRAGVRATGAFDYSYRYRDESRRYLLGPSVFIGLPHRFAAEANLLYSRAGLGDGDCLFTYCSVSSTRGNIWTIPLLLRYPLTSATVKPYLLGGYSLRVTPDATTEVDAWRSGPVVPDEQVDYTVRHYSYSEPGRTSHGATVGGGIAFPVARLQFLPEVRYTRWNSSYWEQSGSRGAYRASQPNQVDILLGIRF